MQKCPACPDLPNNKVEFDCLRKKRTTNPQLIILCKPLVTDQAIQKNLFRLFASEIPKSISAIEFKSTPEHIKSHRNIQSFKKKYKS